MLNVGRVIVKVFFFFSTWQNPTKSNPPPPTPLVSPLGSFPMEKVSTTRIKGLGNKWTERRSAPRPLSHPAKTKTKQQERQTGRINSLAAGLATTSRCGHRTTTIGCLGDLLFLLIWGGWGVGGLCGHSLRKILKGTSSARDGSFCQESH